MHDFHYIAKLKSTVLRAPMDFFIAPKGLFQGSKRNTKAPGSWVLERYGIYIYIIASMSVDALDEAGALTFGSKENFWEVTIHDKRTSATFYARPTPINIPARSISDLRNEKWSKSRIWESRIWVFWRFEIVQE